MYLYIDESVFVKDGEEFCGVGLLITEMEISNYVIEEAMENLGGDPDIEDTNTKKIDYNTLERKYFHSADDSKNAHSHLCRSIVKNVNGEFIYAYTKPHPDNLKKTIEEKHKLNTQKTTLILTHYEEPLNIIIEQRSDLSQGGAERLIDNLYNEIDKSVYTHPFLSAIYPFVAVQVVDKNNPGIQVVDFILWAVNNNYSNTKKTDWVKRLNLKLLSKYDQPEGDMAGGDFVLNSKITPHRKIGINTYPNEVFPLEDDYYETVSFKELYILVEQTLHFFSTEGLPEHAKHFETKLNELTRRLRETIHITRESILEAARTFIRLFDTIPIYRSLDVEKNISEFEVLLHARRCMGLIICEGRINGRSAISVFIDIRNELIESGSRTLFSEPKYGEYVRLTM